MTYRDRIDEGPRCRFHKLAPAPQACTQCGAPICDVCVTYAALHVTCPGCAVAVDQRVGRKRKALVVGLLGVFGVLGAGLWKVTQAGPDLPASVLALEIALKQQPCSEDTIVAILDEMIQVRAHERAVTRIHDYLGAGCEEFPKLRWRERTALERGGQHEAAAAVITRLLEKNPRDLDYWWWRGESREHQGKLEEAARDYEQAIALNPRTNSITEKLAHVYDKLGRPCEGVGPLVQMLHFDTAGAQTEDVTLWASKLATSRACQPFAVTGTARLPLAAGHARGPARLDGAEPGVFEADPKISAVLVSTAFAARLGLALGAETRLVWTPSGLQTARLGRAGRVEILGAAAPSVNLAVVDELPEGVDGILGLAFLLRFRVQPDALGVALSPPPAGSPPADTP